MSEPIAGLTVGTGGEDVIAGLTVRTGGEDVGLQVVEVERDVPGLDGLDGAVVVVVLAAPVPQHDQQHHHEQQQDQGCQRTDDHADVLILERRGLGRGRIYNRDGSA